jgi:hypothetical protein
MYNDIFFEDEVHIRWAIYDGVKVSHFNRFYPKLTCRAFLTLTVAGMEFKADFHQVKIQKQGNGRIRATLWREKPDSGGPLPEFTVHQWKTPDGCGREFRLLTSLFAAATAHLQRDLRQQRFEREQDRHEEAATRAIGDEL